MVDQVPVEKINGLFWEPILVQEDDQIVLYFKWMQDKATAVQTITKTGVDTTGMKLTFLNKSYRKQLETFTPKEYCLAFYEPPYQIDYNPKEFELDTAYQVSFTFTVHGFMKTAHYLHQMRQYRCTDPTEPLAWNEEATIDLFTETPTQIVLIGPVAHVLSSKCNQLMEQLLRP